MGTTWGRVTGFIQRRPPSQKVVAAAAGLLLCTAPFGGLAAVPPPSPEALHGRATVDLGPLEVTLHDVVSARSLTPSIVPYNDGARLLGLHATVRNTSDAPVSAHTLADAVRVQGLEPLHTLGEALGEPQVFHALDGTRTAVLNPGLEMDLVITWEHEAPVRTVDIVLEDLHYTETGALTLLTHYWSPSGRVAAIDTFAVEVSP